jgi:hypothetical protein
MKAVWLVLPAALVVGLCTWLPAQTAPDQDPMLRAMRDEIERSRKLTVPGLERPYFLQYRVEEVDNFAVSATLGGVVGRRRSRARLPEIQVRVGDHKFDNTNYAGGFGGSRYGTGPLPIENDYGVLRRFLWLGTDSSYKAAVEAISRKRAALRNLTVTDEINDFAKAEPVKVLRQLQPLAIDEEEWVKRVRSLSGIFDRYPEVRSSSVDLEAGTGGVYLVNSEGTEIRIPEGTTYLRVRASAQAKDGMTVRDAVVFNALDPTRMALEPEMQRAANSVASNVVALAKAPRGEDYSGPVLFEGVAAAQLFAEVLGKNFAIPRRPVTEPGRPGGSATSELEGRQGARILPEYFTVTDDPTQKEWRGRPLFGSYEIDREGVPVKPLQLVDKGVLKGFLMTRQPVRGFESSNGRARLPGNFGAQAAAISNLFISAAETVPAGALKKQLIETIRTRNKPYGVIVRKMDYPSSATFDEARRLLSGGQSGSSRPVSMPLLVFKVYPDGREELVRGLRFRGLNARSFKDIMAAGNDANLFEFLDSNAPFALMDASNYAAETSVVAPSILIDDLELHPMQDEMPKLPVAPPPEIVQ